MSITRQNLDKLLSKMDQFCKTNANLPKITRNDNLKQQIQSLEQWYESKREILVTTKDSWVTTIFKFILRTLGFGWFFKDLGKTDGEILCEEIDAAITCIREFCETDSQIHNTIDTKKLNKPKVENNNKNIVALNSNYCLSLNVNEKIKQIVNNAVQDVDQIISELIRIFDLDEKRKSTIKNELFHEDGSIEKTVCFVENQLNGLFNGDFSSNSSSNTGNTIGVDKQLLRKCTNAVLDSPCPRHLVQILVILNKYNLLNNKNLEFIISYLDRYRYFVYKPEEDQENKKSNQHEDINTATYWENKKRGVIFTVKENVIDYAYIEKSSASYGNFPVEKSSDDLNKIINTLQPGEMKELSYDDCVQVLNENQKLERIKLIESLHFLYNNNILNQENFDSLMQVEHKNLFAYIDILAKCNQMQVTLTDATTKKILSYSYSVEYFQEALVQLQSVQQFTNQGNVDKLQASLNRSMYNTFSSIPNSLKFLQESNILNQNNFDILMVEQHHDSKTPLQCFISVAHQNHALTQTTFNQYVALANEENDDTFFSPYNDFYSHHLPPHLKTPDAFSALVKFCAQFRRMLRQDILNPASFLALINFAGNGEDAIVRADQYVARLLNDNHNIVINDTQSTHTASVHKSVSESASQLQKSYNDQLNKVGLDNVISKLSDDIKQLFNTTEFDSIEKRLIAANCAVDRIKTLKIDFTDPSSNISIKTLLALCYLASQDDEKRHENITKKDAFLRLVEALYEIQRGYNLSDKNQDDGLDNKPICASGTFNKLIEPLATMHKDCEIRYITKTTAALALPCIVRGEIMRYLSSFTNPQTVQELLTFTNLIERLKKEGLCAIWNKIKDQVASDMLDEYGALFQNNPKDEDFLNFIETGQCVTLDNSNFTHFQKEVTQSIGYHQYCGQILHATNLTFFDQQFNKIKEKDIINSRNDSAENRKTFDQCYGIVLKK